MAPGSRQGGHDNNGQGRLRREMYQLDQDIAVHNDDVLDLQSDALKKYIKRADEQAQRMDKASDQTLAASTFKRLVTAGCSKVTMFCRKSTAATPAALARALVAKYATGAHHNDEDDRELSAFDWHRFGTLAAEYYSTVASASMDCMLGAVDPPKHKKAPAKREKRHKAGVGPEKHPDDMDTEKQDDTNETSKLTESMYKRVEGHPGRAYVHFVLDHESFAQTVENMFSISMLVGNAKVALRLDDTWGTRVELPSGSGGQGRPKGEAAQMVININHRVWNDMKAAVCPSDCLTPHRAAINFLDDDGGHQVDRQAKRARVGT